MRHEQTLVNACAPRHSGPLRHPAHVAQERETEPPVRTPLGPRNAPHAGPLACASPRPILLPIGGRTLGGRNDLDRLPIVTTYTSGRHIHIVFEQQRWLP